MRRFSHICLNLQGLLKVLRRREAAFLVLRDAYAALERKRRFVADTSEALPRLRQRLEENGAMKEIERNEKKRNICSVVT